MKKIMLVCFCTLIVSLCSCTEITPGDEERTSSSPQTSESSSSLPQESVAYREEKPSFTEFRGLMQELLDDANAASENMRLKTVRSASNLMNWGVGTTMTAEEIEIITADILCAWTEQERTVLTEYLALVDNTYKDLLGNDDQALLSEAGCENAAYPWSEEPLFTVEALMHAAGLR